MTAHRTETIAANVRWNELTRWADRAASLGLEDVRFVLMSERMDACVSGPLTAQLVERARAACLLHAFNLDDED